jgi:hypothetical protein
MRSANARSTGIRRRKLESKPKNTQVNWNKGIAQKDATHNHFECITSSGICISIVCSLFVNVIYKCC